MQKQKTDKAVRKLQERMITSLAKHSIKLVKLTSKTLQSMAYLDTVTTGKKFES